MARWWDKEARTMEDERAVAALRGKMERIMAQLEATIEEMREALEEEDRRDTHDGLDLGSDGNGHGP